MGYDVYVYIDESRYDIIFIRMIVIIATVVIIHVVMC